uniref:Locustamyotropin-4 n=3 Tax=Locusta migratoria TaxID=7004 RepID=LMT4_LOCMI|nr:RecName: Full=Locustamyotropin-4; AltName: Full=Lom-MT-4 [Locusta migratoria]prf//1913346B locustamyotropin IV [Locusta migratoria]
RLHQNGMPFSPRL